MKKIAAKTLGCKTNQYETEAILSKLPSSDFTVVDFSQDANLYLINTCCVTHRAEAKSRYEIRKIIKNHPHSQIFVSGCYVNLGAEFLSKYKNRLHLYKNDEKPFIADDILTGKKTTENLNLNVFPEIGLNHSIYHSRVPVKVQDGCNFNCAYCILPNVRGKPRSRDSKKVIEQVRKLVKQQVREIILTGINLGLYGVDRKDYNLQSLIEDISTQTEIEQIRISSLEPMLLDSKLIQYLSKNSKIVPHFHISLQSGCNRTLKKMYRVYGTTEVAEIFTKIKTEIPHAAIGCDVIVGFPGETDKDFEITYNFIKENPINYLHVFPYSERPGTKAASMDNKIHSKIKKKRMHKLRELESLKKMEYLNFLLEENIILKAVAEKKTSGQLWQSVSDHYIKVAFKSEMIEKGETVTLQPIKYLTRSQSLLCEVVDDQDK